MKGLLPYDGLQITSGSGTFGLTTTNAQFNIWGQVIGDQTKGDSSVRADLANSRILCAAPGVYKSTLKLCGTTGTAGIVNSQFRKNAATLISGTLCPVSWAGSSAQNLTSFVGIFSITSADLTAANAVANFPDPTQSANAYYGSVAGAGMAPKSEVPIDLVLNIASGTATLTIQEAFWLIERIG